MTKLFGELALALTAVLAAASADHTAGSADHTADSAGQTFDVVGWYVGDNFTDWPIESLRWDVYSTIRFGSVRVADDGTASSPDSSDASFARMLAMARAHNRTLTLAPGIDAYGCVANATRAAACQRYLDTVGDAVRSIGPGIAGIEFDYECPPTAAGRAGIVSKAEARAFTALLDGVQRALGAGYTASADVGVWGVSQGSYPLGLTPWVDAGLMQANPNLFVNTMSYHAPKSCSVAAWKKDALQMTAQWGLRKEQVNLGIGYFSFNVSGLKTTGEPTWHSLSERCPNVDEKQCACDKIGFASKSMNFEIAAFVREHGYRGLFPWAANYDSFRHNNSLIAYVGRGLGIAA